MSQFYQHSGAVPIGGAIRTTMEGVAAATFLAIIYSYAINYIPIVHANILLTLGFGAVVGVIISHESRSTKIRNSLIPAAIGIVSGLAGLYVAWAIDLVARGAAPANRGFLVGLDPRVLLPYIEAFYTNGAWGIGKGGGVVSGIPLAIVWLAEAGVIVGLAAWIPWNAYRTNVFCESCDKWAESSPDVLRLSDAATEDILGRVRDGDFAVFQTAVRADPAAGSFLRVKLDCCDTCGETNCMGIDQVRIQVDKEGKASEKPTPLVNRMLISRSDVESMRRLAEQPLPAEVVGAGPTTSADETAEAT